MTNCKGTWALGTACGECQQCQQSALDGARELQQQVRLLRAPLTGEQHMMREYGFWAAVGAQVAADRIRSRELSGELVSPDAMAKEQRDSVRLAFDVRTILHEFLSRALTGEKIR